MKNELKMCVFKFFLINATIALFYILLCAFFEVFFSWAKITYILFDYINYAYIIFFVFGWSMVIFSLVFKIELIPKKAKPLKKQLIPKSNNELIKKFSDYLSKYKYDQFKLVDYDFFQVKIFYRVKKFVFFKKIDFIILVMKEYLEKGDLDLFDDKINILLDKKIDSIKPNVLSFTSIICVDKNSCEFQKYVNNNTRQSFDVFKLLVGISYEDSKIFISNQDDGYAISQYKKLKRFFIKMIEYCNR